jgi:hypothetical protein
MMSERESSKSKPTNRIGLVRDFVHLQERIISKAVSILGASITEFDFKKSIPKSMIVDDCAWTTHPHGVGVMFVNRRTKIIVDVHVGFIDAPTAFDAGRLVQYCESRFGTDEEYDSWNATLKLLESQGMIDSHPNYDRHYVLV